MIAKIYPDGHPDLQGKKDPTHPVRYFDIRKLTPRECYSLMGVPPQQIDTLMQTEKKPYMAWVGVDAELAVFGLEPSATRREVDEAYREALESLRPTPDPIPADAPTRSLSLGEGGECEGPEDEQPDDPDIARIMAEKAEEDAEDVAIMRQNYEMNYQRIIAASQEQRYGDVQIISNSSHYKLAGNSIVCDVLMYIYEELMYPTGRRLPQEQTDLFAKPQFRLTRDWKKEPLKLVTLCSGYDSQAIAMDMLKERYPDFRWEMKAWSEFDPESSRPLEEQPAVVAHNLLFPQYKDLNLGDMTKIDWKKFMEYGCYNKTGDNVGREAESDEGNDAATDKCMQGRCVEHNNGSRRGQMSGELCDVGTLSDNGDSHRVRLKEGDIDLLTYSTPCTDISQAGKRAGIKKGSGTRSAVLWSTEEAVRHMRPKVLLQENVRALINSVNMPDFREWCSLLESHGYVNFLAPSFPTVWGTDKRDKKTVPGILNAKHYGVPQNRERVYMVSIRADLLGGSERVAGEYSPATQYEFPRPFPLDKCIADVLEDNVDERFFLKPDSVIKFLTVNEATDGSDIHYMVTDHKLSDEEIAKVRSGRM